MGTLALSTLARRMAPVSLVLALLVGGVAAGCGDKHPPTKHVDATAAEIVKQNTADRLLALKFKKTADGDALRAFLAAIQSAKGRDDLRAAWAGQTSLATKSATFLDDVFQHAEAEKRWPKPPAPEADPAAIELASVEGVRQAVDEFVK